MGIEEKSIVITSAVRTAIGSFCGSLKNMQLYFILLSLLIKLYLIFIFTENYAQ